VVGPPLPASPEWWPPLSASPEWWLTGHQAAGLSGNLPLGALEGEFFPFLNFAQADG